MNDTAIRTKGGLSYLDCDCFARWWSELRSIARILLG